ncbi:hypothetical protein B0H10DRAFT_2437358 [Mycena sp. CBHHK59/15]|nr:hypothetical protein B0H10DRAFT_2437358 [Mycena sp. CBHHK59/15]
MSTGQEDNGPVEDRDQDGDQDGDEDGDEDGTDIDGIHWKELQLMWTLITSIEEDEEMQRSLFPPPGSVKLSDRKPKSNYQYLLAVKCFATHPKYMEAFSKAILPKDMAKWTNKIKNRLKA